MPVTRIKISNPERCAAFARSVKRIAQIEKEKHAKLFNDIRANATRLYEWQMPDGSTKTMTLSEAKTHKK